MHHSRKKQAEKSEAQAQDAQAAQDQAVADAVAETEQAAAAAPAPDANSAGDDMVGQLNSLSQLHESGVLTDEEFAAAKAKLLA